MGRSHDIATSSHGDTRYVNAAGDSMTGNLEVDGIIEIDKTGDHPALRFVEDGSNTRAYMGSGDWAINGLANDDFGISSSSTGDLVLGTTAGVERLRIRNTGQVTKPSQPRFRAHTTASTDITTQATIIYNATTLNVGSHYNTSNGQFTAPVAGLYTFTSVHYHNYGTAGEVRLSLFKNGSELENSRNSRSTSHNYYDRLRLTTELELAANDYVYIRGQGIGGGQLHTSSGLGYSDFFGHLVG